jgi:hypothetical protein
VRSQQNIVVTVILILVVLAVLAGVITWFTGGVESTKGNATGIWTDINCALNPKGC